MRFGLGLTLASARHAHEEEEDVPANRYLYIDGGCLRAATKKILSQMEESSRSLELNLARLANGYDRVFYYDAISAKGHDESISDYRLRVEQEHARFDKIRALDSFHVVLGEIKGRANKRQKRVDVHLAVDMMLHTFRKNMGSATLLAGDDDFIPLIEALVREGMKIRVWAPKQATSELLAAADHRQPLNLATIYHYFEEGEGEPAYQFVGGGDGDPNKDTGLWFWDNERQQGAARFAHDHLKVWKRQGDQWAWNELKAPRSSLAGAARVYSAVTNSSVYGPSGEDLTWRE